MFYLCNVSTITRQFDGPSIPLNIRCLPFNVNFIKVLICIVLFGAYFKINTSIGLPDANCYNTSRLPCILLVAIMLYFYNMYVFLDCCLLSSLDTMPNVPFEYIV